MTGVSVYLGVPETLPADGYNAIPSEAR